jgi:hypothetical protein
VILRAGVDLKLEKWAAERAGEAFVEVYERPLVVEKAKS